MTPPEKDNYRQDLVKSETVTQTIVIFGASGDLTSRKLIPSLYELHRKGRLRARTRIVGFSRTPFAHEAWRAALAQSTARFLGAAYEPVAWDAFASSLYYHAGDLASLDDVRSLGAFLSELEGEGSATRIYYLSTAPRFYAPAALHLGAAGMAAQRDLPRRIVVEKPFGADLATARALNEALHASFAERQIYRIDHYLGKETVQNVLVFRFANTVFEPIWNRNYVSHVEITAAEDMLVGHRGGYYDASGVLCDMLQNHLLQLLCLTAMEAPARFEAEAIRDEKVKVLRAIRPMRPAQVEVNTLRGQYAGYREEPGVAPDSATATFAAVRLSIDNWRWQGVPFFLRSGKGMSCRTTHIVIQFRQPPLVLFDREHASGWTDDSDPAGKPSPCAGREANRLVIQLQPAEGIQLHFQTKVPDAGMQTRLAQLSFRFRDAFAAGLPDAYQRLLMDVMQGDASLFSRCDEVELAWGVVDPIVSAWEDRGRPLLVFYEPGLWGPEESTDWIDRHGHAWFDFCPVLHP
jgi:glucose-6-phosphate 1-dehydrogenase